MHVFQLSKLMRCFQLPFSYLYEFLLSSQPKSFFLQIKILQANTFNARSFHFFFVTFYHLFYSLVEYKCRVDIKYVNLRTKKKSSSIFIISSTLFFPQVSLLHCELSLLFALLSFGKNYVRAKNFCLRVPLIFVIIPTSKAFI